MCACQWMGVFGKYAIGSSIWVLPAEYHFVYASLSHKKLSLNGIQCHSKRCDILLSRIGPYT